MKKRLFYLALLIPVWATAQECPKNAVLSEPMFMPTAQDSVIYEKIKNKHNDKVAGEFDYKVLPYIRNVSDTDLIARDNPLNVPASILPQLNISPLIMEGEIIQVIEADTSATAKYVYYSRTYIIKVKDVVKSRYKVAPGERIAVKTYLSGYRRDPNTHRVRFQTSYLSEYYQPNKTYMFVLDKYEYMSDMYKIKTADTTSDFKDEYCPTSFSMNASTVAFSKQYDMQHYTKQDILKYFSPKK
ncbi:MAG: hypothetical protein EOP51_06010 [Sphingobacteriales bacterium]|nr:MAG: hypothetical protein EOP51_06010 [Sphingobacteriales bacterium]